MYVKPMRYDIWELSDITEYCAEQLGMDRKEYMDLFIKKMIPEGVKCEIYHLCFSISNEFENKIIELMEWEVYYGDDATCRMIRI